MEWFQKNQQALKPWRRGKGNDGYETFVFESGVQEGEIRAIAFFLGENK